MTRIAPHIYRYPTQSGERYAIRYYFRNGERWKKGLLTKKRAERYLRKLLVRLDDAKHFPERILAPKLKDYAKQWLALQELRGLAPNTLRSYRMNLTLHVLPALGEERLNELTRSHVVQLMLAKQKAGMAPNSIRLVVAPLSALLMTAMDEQLIQTNPAVRPSRILPVRRKQRKLEILTRAQERALLTVCKRERPDHFALISLLLSTGLRISEALALERTDVDLARKTLSITKGWTNGHLTSWTKGGRARRVILTAGDVRELRGWLKTHTKPILFPGDTEQGYLNERSWRRHVWLRLLKLAKIGHRGIHITRHTYATRMLEQGKSLAWLKAQLGHSSIAVTVDLYGHFAQQDTA